MQALFSSVMARAGGQIDTEAKAEGPPPARLRPFMSWCLKGGWRVVWLGVLISVLAGITEVLSMYLLGLVVDAVDSGGPFLVDHWMLAASCIALLLSWRGLCCSAGWP